MVSMPTPIKLRGNRGSCGALGQLFLSISNRMVRSIAQVPTLNAVTSRDHTEDFGVRKYPSSNSAERLGLNEELAPHHEAPRRLIRFGSCNSNYSLGVGASVPSNASPWRTSAISGRRPEAAGMETASHVDLLLCWPRAIRPDAVTRAGRDPPRRRADRQGQCDGEKYCDEINDRQHRRMDTQRNERRQGN